MADESTCRERWPWRLKALLPVVTWRKIFCVRKQVVLASEPVPARQRRQAHRIIFITGTDTGVGKTLLTGLLLHYLRHSGCHALAMKPFCSGSRADAEFLHAVQENELTLDEINPFFFSEPLAPLVAARKHQRSICLSSVLRRIRSLASRCQCLLVEGIGGVMVPLGEGFCVADLIFFGALSRKESGSAGRPEGSPKNN
ncbi:MAG: dethiobiotin synthase [Verrucomicrobia bacterium]|nr:dethiobiotin synthase [Verrucomicrobiota bacterium]